MSVFESFMTGQRAGQQDYDRRQRQQIGGLMASGDYDTARQQAFGAGQFDLGTYAQGQQTAQQTKERQAEAGRLYGEDPNAARNYALAQGDFELGAQLDEMFANATEAERKRAAEGYDLLAGIAAPFRQIPYEQRRAAIMQQAPMLMQLGMTQEQIAAFDPTDANIDAIVGMSIGAKNHLEMQYRREDELYNRGIQNRRVAVTESREGRVAGNAGRSGGGSRTAGGGSSRPVSAPRAATAALPPGFRIRR